jgi:uncharacterized protein
VHIWVDGDACPKVIKDILFRAAVRCKIELVMVANRALAIPPSPWIKMSVVSAGFDEADEAIVDKIKQGDLVITADIPLAARVVEKGALALNPRGQWYNAETVQAHLARRNFMQELRDSGIQTGGPAALSQSDRQQFANALDQSLNAYVSRRDK